MIRRPWSLLIALCVALAGCGKSGTNNPAATTKADGETPAEQKGQPLPDLSTAHPEAKDTVALRGADALVMVAENRGGEHSILRPGIVFHSDDKVGYILVKRAGPSRSAARYGTRRELPAQDPVKNAATPAGEPSDVRPAFKVIWDTPKGRRTVDATLIASFRQPAQSILTAPVGDLPAPIPQAPSQWKESMHVRVVGFQIRTEMAPSSFTRTESEGTFRSIFRTDSGDAERVVMQGDGFEQFHGLLVFDSHGTPVAYSLEPRSRRQSNYPAEEIVPRTAAYPLSRLAVIGAPELQLLTFAPVKEGDHSEFEFVAIWQDPYSRIRSPRLLLLSENQAGGSGHDYLRSQHPVRKLPDAATVTLAQGSPTIPLSRFRGVVEETAGVRTWVGRHTNHDTSLRSPFRFIVQLVTNDAQGQAVYHQPTPCMHIVKPKSRVRSAANLAELEKLLPRWKEAWNSHDVARLVELMHPDFEPRKSYASNARVMLEASNGQKKAVETHGDIETCEVGKYIAGKQRYVVRITYTKKGLVPGTMAIAKGPSDAWLVTDFNIDGQGEPELKE